MGSPTFSPVPTALAEPPLGGGELAPSHPGILWRKEAGGWLYRGTSGERMLLGTALRRGADTPSLPSMFFGARSPSVSQVGLLESPWVEVLPLRGTGPIVWAGVRITAPSLQGASRDPPLSRVALRPLPSRGASRPLREGLGTPLASAVEQEGRVTSKVRRVLLYALGTCSPSLEDAQDERLSQVGAALQQCTWES